MNYLRSSRFNILPPVVKNLLIINVLLFLATTTFYSIGFVDLNRTLGLYYWGSNNFESWQIITHMFMHGGFTHLFFNMFAIWMFGAQLENMWGSKRFLNYYILTGFGAAFLHFIIIHFQIENLENIMNQDTINTIRANGSELLQNHRNYVDINMGRLNVLYHTPVVGASGALFGILIAFGMLFPNTLLFFIFIPIPIKAKYFVLFYGLAELFYGLQNNPSDNIAHFAHLGGMIFGFLIIKFWQNNR